LLGNLDSNQLRQFINSGKLNFLWFLNEKNENYFKFESPREIYLFFQSSFFNSYSWNLFSYKVKTSPFFKNSVNNKDDFYFVTSVLFLDWIFKLPPLPPKPSINLSSEYSLYCQEIENFFEGNEEMTQKHTLSPNEFEFQLLLHIQRNTPQNFVQIISVEDICIQNISNQNLFTKVNALFEPGVREFEQLLHFLYNHDFFKTKYQELDTLSKYIELAQEKKFESLNYPIPEFSSLQKSTEHGFSFEPQKHLTSITEEMTSNFEDSSFSKEKMFENTPEILKLENSNILPKLQSRENPVSTAEEQTSSSISEEDSPPETENDGLFNMSYTFEETKETDQIVSSGLRELEKTYPPHILEDKVGFFSSKKTSSDLDEFSQIEKESSSSKKKIREKKKEEFKPKVKTVTKKTNPSTKKSPKKSSAKNV
jgi:hypothetical protein